MARGNRAFKSEKRTKELRRLKKQEEKRQRKPGQAGQSRGRARGVLSRRSARRPAQPGRSRTGNVLRPSANEFVHSPPARNPARGRSAGPDEPPKGPMKPSGGPAASLFSAAPVRPRGRRRSRPAPPRTDPIQGHPLDRPRAGGRPDRPRLDVLLHARRIPGQGLDRCRASPAPGRRARRYFPGQDLLRPPGDLFHDPRLRRGRTALHGDP